MLEKTEEEHTGVGVEITSFAAEAGQEVCSVTLLTFVPGGKALEEAEEFFTMLEGLFWEDSLALAGGALSVLRRVIR